MIKFKIFLEESEEMPDIKDLTDSDWFEGIIDDYFDWSSINSEQDLVNLFKLENKHNKSFFYEKVTFPSSKTVYISGYKDKTEYVYELSQGSYSRKDANDWIADIGDSAHEYFGFFSDDRFNKEFWQYPVPLYHGTKNMIKVLKMGLEPRYETRGISNRSTGATIFATTEPDETESYAQDGIVVINTDAMKKDGYMPFVSQEEPLQDSDQISAIAHKIGVEYYPDEQYSSDGLSLNTVIIHGKVEPKYLRNYNEV